MSSLSRLMCYPVEPKTKSRTFGSSIRRSNAKLSWCTPSITNSISALISRKIQMKTSRGDTDKRMRKNSPNLDFNGKGSLRPKMAATDRGTRKKLILSQASKRTNSPKIRTQSLFWVTQTTKTKTLLNLRKPLSPKRNKSRNKRRQSWRLNKRSGIKIPNPCWHL